MRRLGGRGGSGGGTGQEEGALGEGLGGGAVLGDQADAGTPVQQVVDVVGALVGLGLVLLGVNTSIWVGVAGFVIIVAAVAYAATPGHTDLKVVTEDGSIQQPGGSRTKGASRTPKGRSRKTPNQSTFMQRMEQRWEERRRQGY